MSNSPIYLQNQLIYALTFTKVISDGTVIEQRKLVEKIGKIKFEIYPNEHAPAHFHVIIYDKNYSFSIIGCTPLFETTDSRTMKQIEYFYNNNKLKLIETWNELRPSNCPVGSITM